MPSDRTVLFCTKIEVSPGCLLDFPPGEDVRIKLSHNIGNPVKQVQLRVNNVQSEFAYSPRVKLDVLNGDDSSMDIFCSSNLEAIDCYADRIGIRVRYYSFMSGCCGLERISTSETVKDEGVAPITSRDIIVIFCLFREVLTACFTGEFLKPYMLNCVGPSIWVKDENKAGVN